MKIKSTLLFFFILSFPFNSFCQLPGYPNEGSNWYFGSYAGLTWNTLQPDLNPTPLMYGELETMEGVATISDPFGVLLFYTDGQTVWAVDHSVWPNTLPGSTGGTLQGNASSTQSGVIVPKPLDLNTYYIFAVDNNIGADGLTYSRVDMSANFGLGDIDLAEKNMPLHTPSCEKVAGVEHANGVDFWVIAHSWNTGDYISYLVSNANGVDAANPVISTVGTIMTGGSGGNVTRGYLKVSPGGGKVAAGIEGLNIYELYDFDNATGILSNPLTLTNPVFDDCYGVEFSPNEQFLYGSERWGYDIHQWDISLPTSAAIIASHNIVATLPNSGGGALQLAPDMKIYLARQGKKYLGCINDPYSYGTACNYVDQQVLLGPDVNSARLSREGLPTFLSTFFNEAVFEFVTSCDNDTTFFTIPNAQQLDMAYWNFNYPSTDPIYNLEDSAAEQWFIYPEGGLYTVEMVTERNGDFDTIYQDVYIVYSPIVDLGPDAVLCTNEVLTYDLSFNDQYDIDGACDYFWSADLGTLQFYDSTATYLIDKPGIYTVTVETDSICGSVTDSIIVVYNNVEADLGVDITSGLCVGDEYTLDAEYVNISYGLTYYQWNTNQISSSINVMSSGLYSVTLTLGQCQDVDSILVSFDTPLYSPFGQDINLCAGSITTLDASNMGSSYVWSTGVFSQTIDVDIPGIYSVSVTNACGTLVDEIIVNPLDVPVFDLGPDITICEGLPEVVSAFVDGAIYEWSTGAVTPQIVVTTAENYSVTVSNECGTSSDAINVIGDLPINDLDLGADTSVCQGYELDAGYPDLEYFWSNSETTQVIEINSSDDYSVDITNACGTYTDFIHIDIIELEVDLGPDITICPGEVATLAAGNAGAAFNWSTGASTETIEVSNAGEYSVMITNVCETKHDTIVVDIFDMTLNIGDDQAICEGSVFVLDAEHPGSTYAWSTGETTQTIEVDQADTYSVSLTHICGSLDDDIVITMNPLPIVEFSQDVFSIGENQTVTLEPLITGISYEWSTGETTSSIVIGGNESGEGYYYVTVTDENGCEGIGEVYVDVLVGIEPVGESNTVILYPNPTRDRLNIAINNIDVENIIIYNSIGKLVGEYICNGNEISIETYNLTEGVYYVKVYSTKGEYFIKPFSVIK